MIKVHTKTWGYRGVDGTWIEHLIYVYYRPSGENSWDRFVVALPPEIARVLRKSHVTGETLEKVIEKLNAAKEEYIEGLAPKEKTKIIRYRVCMSPRDYDRVSISVEHRVLWMVRQEGRKYRLEEEDGTRLDSGDFDPERDKTGWMPWMHWTQARENFFVDFEKNLQDLSKKFERFYASNYPQDSDALAKAIDSGVVVPPFENGTLLLKEENERLLKR